MEKDEGAACRAVPSQHDQAALQGPVFVKRIGRACKSPAVAACVGTHMTGNVSTFNGGVADVGQGQLQDAGERGSVRVCQKAHQHHRPQRQELRPR